MQPLDDFAAVLNALRDGDVAFVVVGGIAVIAHGYARATRDIDVVVDSSAENLARARHVVLALGATRQNGAPLAADDLRAGRPWILRTRHAQLDVLPDVDVDFATLREGATVRKVDGVEVPICSLAHLVRLKRNVGRTKDLLDLEKLEEALGELPD